MRYYHCCRRRHCPCRYYHSSRQYSSNNNRDSIKKNIKYKSMSILRKKRRRDYFDWMSLNSAYVLCKSLFFFIFTAFFSGKVLSFYFSRQSSSLIWPFGMSDLYPISVQWNNLLLVLLLLLTIYRNQQLFPERVSECKNNNNNKTYRNQ